ncbi:hypothetical protein ACOMCU_01530 [Lysinibacillus sp. UGB7]|uniref:hypothetical protein n=1 Tax=Lysinibacillus sp. UGB7 TaxID=3411039 RepID=UPI003B805D69
MQRIQTEVLKEAILQQKKHNPEFKLLSVFVNIGGKYMDLVYEKSSNGIETLEVYYYDTKYRGNGSTTSRAWEISKVPKKYKEYVEALQKRIRYVRKGYKLSMQLV